jgi:hypothetical protein
MPFCIAISSMVMGGELGHDHLLYNMLHVIQETPAGDPAAASRAAEAEWEAIQAGGWPFQSLCDALCADLVSPRWELRHGCAMALREVLRSHACAASVRAPLSGEPSGDALDAARPPSGILYGSCSANLEGRHCLTCKLFKLMDTHAPSVRYLTAMLMCSTDGASLHMEC